MAVPDTRTGTGSTIFVAMDAAVSIFPTSTSALCRTGFVVYGSTPSFCAHLRAAPFTPRMLLAAPPAASSALSRADPLPSSAFLSSLVTESAVRLALRPRLTPNRLSPPPMPLAVPSGSFTTLATPLPTASTAPPAAFAKISPFDTSDSRASAPTSSTRVRRTVRPSASMFPKSETISNTW